MTFLRIATCTTTARFRNAQYIRNPFGGRWTGPIRRDKTFFSFAYDSNQIGAGATGANIVPTSAALSYMQPTGGPLVSSLGGLSAGHVGYALQRRYLY